MSNSSHYYRFKRHSLGYQSQGPSINAMKGGSLLTIDAMHGITSGPREQSQTAQGVGAFSSRINKAHHHQNHQVYQTLISPISVNLLNANDSTPLNSIVTSGGASGAVQTTSAKSNLLGS